MDDYFDLSGFAGATSTLISSKSVETTTSSPMQSPNPPNVTLTALSSNFFEAILTKVENTTFYGVASKKIILIL